jgi:death-on-curing protein
VAVRFLNLAEVLEIHREQTTRWGGTPEIRSLPLLQSALAIVEAGAYGKRFHGDVFEMAAAYLFHIVKNHPFLDGNKRVGASAALVFLELNGVELRMPNEALVELVLGVAMGRTSKAEIAETFRQHLAD